jgi:hypothetical protein
MNEYHFLKEELFLIDEEIENALADFIDIKDLQLKNPPLYLDIIKLRIKAAKIRIRIGKLLSDKTYKKLNPIDITLNQVFLRN